MKIWSLDIFFKTALEVYGIKARDKISWTHSLKSNCEMLLELMIIFLKSKTTHVNKLSVLVITL